MFPRGHARDLTQVFGPHPLILGQLADAAAAAVQGRRATDGLVRGLSVVQAVEGAMHTAGRGERRGFVRALGRTQDGGHIEGGLGRTQLAGLQRQLVEGGVGETRGSWGIVGRCVGR